MSGVSNAQPEQNITRRRSKSNQSGFSLLARGEPQIWFTGGMLVVCLAMIIGLLGLILAYGLPTFWPRQLDVLVLNDGTIETGQPQSRSELTAPKTESPATAENVSDIDSQSPADAESVTQDTDEPAEINDLKPLATATVGTRYYYRTANFDLTGEHYRWIGPELLDDAGITTPAWAMVIERLEDGRLYGLPLQLAEPIELDEAGQEQLQNIDTLLELLVALPTDASPQIPELVERLQAIRVDAIDQRLRERLASDSLQQQPGAIVQIQATSSEPWISLVELSESAKLAAARSVWTAPQTIQQQLQRQIASTTQLREEADDRMLEISRLDAEISQLRAGIRRAEIESKTVSPTRVEDVQSALDTINELDRKRESLQQLASGLTSLFGADEAAKLSAELLQSTLIARMVDDATVAQAEIDAWQRPLESSPELVQLAVKEYLDGYRQVAAKKLPLVSALAALRAKLNATIAFAIPTRGTSLTVDAAAIEQLSRGEPSDSLREQLAANGIELASDRIELSPLSDHLQFATVTAANGSRRMLAIVQPANASANSSNLDGTSAAVLLLPEKVLQVHEIVRAIVPNQLSVAGKFSVYFDRWREFLFDEPREANTEGGIFPAIWGTVVMTLIMTVAVVPFGVMAALYLREYTHAGPLVSLIRISINNLAGVPSIVYGVFGFSFFCYTIGAYIDGGPRNADLVVIPSTPWLIAMGVTAALGTAAFFMSIFGSGPSHSQTRLTRWLSKLALVLWIVCISALAVLVLKSPFFDGFYREYLPNPTFGKGGLLWAALTLSLLTLPVVIVATEEALAAVPNSLREGSLACGASKWQTIRRIILPHARPGILTGAILAMARGAGEVAPLMLVGALPSAPDLPLDAEFPFFHGSRSFMHLGYQIYTLGFQSQNSEAAKPMVFTCTLLLILIVAVLNISAIFLRARLRKRFQGSQF